MGFATQSALQVSDSLALLGEKSQGEGTYWQVVIAKPQADLDVVLTAELTEATVNAITATVQAIFNPVAFAVKMIFNTVAAQVKAIFNTIASAVKPRSQLFFAVFDRFFRSVVETFVDKLAATVKTFVPDLAAVI
jgi:hypothetical protein